MHLKISEAELEDPSFQTDHEELPSGRFILIRDIKKALNGEDFIYYPTMGKGVNVQGTDERTYSEYFNIFRTSRIWGLPHGKGWINELPWVIDFLNMMTDLHQVIENWYESKSIGNNNIGVNEVGL